MCLSNRSFFLLIFTTFTLTICKINAEEDVQNSQASSSPLEITARMAFNLCKKLEAAKIQSKHQFLWTKIKAPEQNTPEILPQCFTIRHKQCDGVSRFPLHSDCKHFSVDPMDSKSCNVVQAMKEQQQSRKRRAATTQEDKLPKLKIETEPVTLNHDHVVDLCMSITHLPATEPFKVGYTPIRLDHSFSHKFSTQKLEADISDECLRWTWKPCQNNDEKCDFWIKKIDAKPECEIFHHLEKKLNTTTFTGRQIVPFVKSDFMQLESFDSSSNLEKKLDIKSINLNILDSHVKLLSDLIECTFVHSDKTSHCSILPKEEAEKSRQKRDAKKTSAVGKVKRFVPGISGTPTKRCFLCECGDYCDTLGICDKRLDWKEKCSTECFGYCPGEIPNLP